MRTATLHAFNFWRYQEIIDTLEVIRTSGYGAILIPPPLYSDPAEALRQRYQPKDYRVLLSHLGGKEQLERLIVFAMRALEPIRVYADLVINHMANEARGDRLNFPGAAELDRYRQDPDHFERNRLYGDLSEGLFSSWFQPGW